jgi:hypothetical protein
MKPPVTKATMGAMPQKVIVARIGPKSFNCDRQPYGALVACPGAFRGWPLPCGASQ